MRSKVYGKFDGRRLIAIGHLSHPETRYQRHKNNMDRMSRLAQQSMFWKMHVSSVITQFKTK